MTATLFAKFAHMSVFAHGLLMLGVFLLVALVVLVAAGDDWNKTPDDFDNWENVP